MALLFSIMSQILSISGCDTKLNLHSAVMMLENETSIYCSQNSYDGTLAQIKCPCQFIFQRTLINNIKLTYFFDHSSKTNIQICSYIT
jgi:hypothetical protein